MATLPVACPSCTGPTALVEDYVRYCPACDLKIEGRSFDKNDALLPPAPAFRLSEADPICPICGKTCYAGWDEPGPTDAIVGDGSWHCPDGHMSYYPADFEEE